jgi:glucarate dehydratase
MTEPSQALFRWQSDDVIEQGPFNPNDNVVGVPEGPGLGVDLSPTALKRCHKRFCDEGPYDQYFNPKAPQRMVRLPLY